MTTPSPNAIDIVGVRKSYGRLEALKGVEFSIARGEFFGLLGPNGAGKSTLINTIAGLVAPDAGHIAVLGHDTVKDFRAARRKLGVVPQELVFDPFFKVVDMLRIQAGYYGSGREVWPWIDEMLERLDLSSKRNSPMRALSGGMKRRVLIAQALVHKPPVVILDEPTAGVDVELRRTLWSFMSDLHRQGQTVVLTTHYLEEAQEMCSRIAILDKGEIKALESTRQLLKRHPFRFLRIKLAGDAQLPDALRPLVSSESDGVIELKLDTSQHPIGGVFDTLRNAGIAIEDVHTREPDLEDIFVELTKREAVK
ncbi:MULTISPECIES: ABC transporter ATP-binding protein [Hydrocarboniphaga]|jgi:ABC-2 type transport system ATP-binding protein|uniref:Abc-type transporter, atpase component, lose family n=1 Tax=Hydrocarboniphaga effusa AP103 TaxID=1172194 RepID=I8T5E8_9GAMM|nr:MULTISPECIES: ABC transporter ATP-binding protein [Hydrocarboniphaga]EIT69140.1 abc-type transporter, atpase component, lose family [Hydrocarboniphaga effusa AP103]MDZ4081002.1 ABC transporter ATP-binding protein [Hydrocarboniphaga sp.]